MILLKILENNIREYCPLIIREMLSLFILFFYLLFMKILSNKYYYIINYIVILSAIFILLYLNIIDPLHCQGIDNTPNSIYFSVEPTYNESTEYMMFMQESETSFIQRRSEQMYNLQQTSHRLEPMKHAVQYNQIGV
jgi:hypothetical protein